MSQQIQKQEHPKSAISSSALCLWTELKQNSPFQKSHCIPRLFTKEIKEVLINLENESIDFIWLSNKYIWLFVIFSLDIMCIRVLTPSKAPPPLFHQASPLNLQTVQAPFLGNSL